MLKTPKQSNVRPASLQKQVCLQNMKTETVNEQSFLKKCVFVSVRLCVGEGEFV